MKILSISDKIVPFLYSSQIREKFSDVEMVLACGDLPYYYIEYIFNALCVPTFFVRGNHDNLEEFSKAGVKRAPGGAVDLHRKVIYHQGLLLAGIEGSVRYRQGPFQHSQGEMWEYVLRMTPALMLNRLRHGRYLDIFISHAPPFGVHDRPDRAHRGIKAFCWLLRVFKPAYHFHGHIHVYRTFTQTVTRYEQTTVINTYGHRVTEIEVG